MSNLSLSKKKTKVSFERGVKLLCEGKPLTVVWYKLDFQNDPIPQVLERIRSAVFVLAQGLSDALESQLGDSLMQIIGSWDGLEDLYVEVRPRRGICRRVTNSIPTAYGIMLDDGLKVSYPSEILFTDSTKCWYVSPLTQTFGRISHFGQRRFNVPRWVSYAVEDGFLTRGVILDTFFQGLEGDLRYFDQGHADYLLTKYNPETMDGQLYWHGKASFLNWVAQKGIELSERYYKGSISK